jgi:TonB family protein
MLCTARAGTALVLAILLAEVAFAQNSVPTAPADNSKQIPASAAPNLSSMPTDPAALLAAGSKVNGLNGPEIAPWHIKATYQEFDAKGKLSSTGSYEEFWFSDKSYKRTYTSPTFTQTDYATERGLYRSGSQAWPGPRETAVRMYLTAPIPGKLGPRDLRLKEESDFIGKAHLQCVSLKSYEVLPSSSLYCFEQGRPMLRLAESPDGLSESLYNDVIEFRKHFIAREIRVTSRDQPVLVIHVDEIGSLSESARAEVTPSLDATGPLAGQIVLPEGTMSPFVLVRVPPVFPAPAQYMRQEGTVILHISVGKDGVVTSAAAISGPDLLRKPAVDSVRKWEFRPFLVLGDPTEVETNLRMEITQSDVSRPDQNPNPRRQ